MQPIWYGLHLGYLQLLADNRASYFHVHRAATDGPTVLETKLGQSRTESKRKKQTMRERKTGQRTKSLLFLGFPAS
jgi:hypothetical protein